MHRKRKANFLNLPISILFIAQPLLSSEIIVDRTRTGQHTTLDTAANGVPVVNIARPNTSGVSHNTYIEFNVPTQGTILNNSDREVNTQLAGYIYGNENVRNGPASLILNEVSGTNRSRLNGYLEVAGQSADVIVANPNGITVNGAGFINIPKATLTTGKVSFSGNRPIFDIEGGDIFIDGKGLDARSTSSLELYTQAIKLNAKLYANDLRVVTGMNHIDEHGTVMSRDSEDKERPVFSIDSTALGGIYANAISLVGTQKGVGVNLPSEMLVQDRLEISSDGKIVLGKVAVTNSATIRSHSSSIEINEGVHAETLDFQAFTDITLHGNSAATRDLTLLGNRLYNDGLLAAGLNADFTQATSGSLHLGFSGSINNEGVFYGLDGIEIDTNKFTNATQAEVLTQTLTVNAVQTLENAGELSANLTTINTQTLSNSGVIHAKDDLSITAENFNNSEGVVEGLESVTVNIENAFLNNNGMLFSNSALTLTAASLEGIHGDIISKDRSDIAVTGLMHMDAGYLESEGLNIQAGELKINSTDLLSYGNVNIVTQNMTSSASTVQALGNIEIDATNSFTQTDHALLYATGDIVLEAQTFNQTNASALQSLGNTEIRTSALVNTQSSVTVNDLSIMSHTVDNTGGELLASGRQDITTNTLYNSEGTIQANETLTVSATGDIKNMSGTLYSGTGTSVTAHTLNNEAGFMASVKSVFLDLFNLRGNQGTISGEGVTIHADSINSDQASIQSSEALDIVASGDVTLTNASMLSNATLNVTAQEAILNGSTLYSADESIKLSVTTVDAQNAYMEAAQTVMLNALENVNVSDSILRGNTLDLSTEEDFTAAYTSFIAGEHLSLNAQTLNLSNASIFSENTGIINTDIFNNINSAFSATQMDINTITFNNSDSNFYSDGGTVKISTSGTLNNHNGLFSTNGDLVLDLQHFDNRNGDLEAGNTLAITSDNVQVEGSRFFAGDHLAVTSNISDIDADTKFLSSNTMDLDFAGDLIHHGEILANGSAEIKVHGDLHNESAITANDSLTIHANTLNNNLHNTDASIRGGYLSSLTLNGNLNNYGLLTSSGNLDITAAEIHNYAGIAAANDLTLNSTNLYNYETLLSGTDMNLYISDLLRNHEDADIYAGNTLTIAKDDTGAKTKKVENISAKIESRGNMRIVAKDISNISATEITTTLEEVNDVIDISCDIWESFSCPSKNIALEVDLMAIKAEIIQEYADNGMTLSDTELQRLLTEEMIKEDRQAYILNMYKDTETTANELYFYELTASLSSNEMIVKRTKPHKKEEFRKVEYTVTKEVVDASSLADHKEGKIISGHNLLLDAETIINKTSLITASNDIQLNGNLVNIGVGNSESIDATINYSWKRKSDGGLGQLPISNAEIRDTGGVPSQILAGGTLTGNFGALQNGMASHASVNTDPNAPSISTSTQTTNDTQTNVTHIDTNVNTPNIEDPTQAVVVNRPLALTPLVYDPSSMDITLPDNSYGLFVTSQNPDGPLIESNPEYTNYNNYVSSDYMLDHLGYDGSSQTRRLGDAMYETQLIRDAIIAMTGQRYIGTAENDNDQYTELMHAGVNYAKEVGLQLGVPPTAVQLEDLTEDLVWMEEKVVNGKHVLVPVLYLAQLYDRATGANINANSMNLTVDGHLGNTESISSREDMILTTGSLTNTRGNIKAGANMNVSSIGDIKNLSASIEGGSVVLSSTQGNIVNQTLSRGIDLQHSVGTEHYTVTDRTASITATNADITLDAAKNIDNTGANITAHSGITLNAGENVNINALGNERAYDYTFSNGSASGQSVTHSQSNVHAGGLLDITSGKDTNLEAVNINVGDTRITAQGNVNITAVVNSSYAESHFENESFISSSSTTDMNLAQSVLGTNIETNNLVIEGNKGVTLESVSVVAGDSLQVTSASGDVALSARSYTNASHHERSSSMLGGLYTERSVDAISETLLSGSSANAENNIVVGGKNIHIVATDLSTENGVISLSATENVNIISGMETRSEEHVREESGLSLGYSDGRFTFAEETTDSTVSTEQTNRASNISTSALMIESGQDTNVIASNITAGAMQVNAGRDFNVLSDNDIITNSEAHSTKEIGVEFTLNSRESSVFAGYWEDENTEDSIQSQVVSSNIQVGSLEVNSENTNVAGSNISGQDIDINSENIRILSDSTNTNADAYTHEIKAGVEVGVRQNLSNVVDAVDEVGESENASAATARGLRAYDALQTFSEQPVTAGVNAIYEESETNMQSTNSQVLGSSITATNSLTLNATNELEIAGSDVGSANALTVNANNINIHASEGTYTMETSSENKNANVGIYGTNMGQATVAYQENEMTTTGTTQRNSQLYSGGTASITSIEDTTLAGANIEARNLALNVGGDLNMESIQDTQTIDGSSRGGSISGGMQGVTGVSANAGETSGERAWISQGTGINGSESVRVNVGGTTTLTGASITNLNEQGVEQGNLEVNTQHLVVNDIKDIDTYDSTSAGIGLNNGEGTTPSLNSVEYTNNMTDREQITRATIGTGSINTESITGTLNRDTSNSQEMTRDESSSIELHGSDRSLALLDDPNGEISNLGVKLDDIGLRTRREILDNIPSIDEIAEEGSILNTALDWASFTNIIPTKENAGGYITQIVTQVFGDNRIGISVTDAQVFEDMGLSCRYDSERKERDNWDYETYQRADGITAYRTNPDRIIRIVENNEEVVLNPDQNIEDMRIYVSADAVTEAGLNHIFTNGLNNTADEALANQQQQQALPDIALLNYNQTHGIVGDLLETGLERVTIALDAVPGVQSIGYVVNGSARQTGNTINQLSEINNGNIHVAAHSQGTQQTYLGLQQNQESIAQELRGNRASVFTLQNSGAPISSVATGELITNIYGGDAGIRLHLDEDSAGLTDVFRSQVNPGDPVAMLGGNFGGVNNNAPIYTSEFWGEVGYTMSRGTTSLMGGTTGENPSPHSGYECVIGCGEGGITPSDIKFYYDPRNQEEVPLTNFYRTINVEPSHSNINTAPVSSDQIPVQIGIGVNQ